MKRPFPYGRTAAVLAGAAVVTVALTSSVPASPPPRRHTNPIGAQQRGFALPAYTQQGYQSPQASKYLEQIADVGATWVELTPTWYQNQIHADTIAATDRTPSDASVEHAIAEAHRIGLKVLLKPLVDLLPDGSVYRGTIRPAGSAAWFASYTGFISHYAELAAQLQVEQFAVGTELAGVSGNRAGWLGVVKAVRTRYSGPLLYAANFDEYRDVTFWDAVDLVGIDAYWKLSPQPTADVLTLQHAWEPIVRELAGFAAKSGRRILFAEAGYASQHGSTTAPWSWTVSSVPDQNEQAAAYQALLAGLHGRPWWAGVFWWAWDVPSASTATDSLGYSPNGKAAEAVVRRWWS